MNKNFFLPYNHIFFIGIGGISQSALATICLSESIKVSGSDKERSEITDHLKRIGVTIYIGHSSKNLNNVDLVVYSGAVSSTNEELMFAKKENISIMERSEFLGILSSKYKKVIAISGVHGKTTTTGMISSIFLKAGLNPTIHIGGELKNFDSNVKIGSKEFFITEACEYRESFLALKPHTGIILNIEEDHLDYYKDLNHILKAFDIFSKNCKNLVIGESYKSFVSKKNSITFSLNGNASFKAGHIKKSYYGTSFSVFKNGEFWGRVKLKAYGKHNVYNALSAIAVGDIYNISKQDIIDGLYSFEGIKRRFDYWGENNSTMIFHDYAHHPTEIMATINTCKEYFKMPIICYFQPHTYSRTKKLFGEFLSAFENADFTYILPTYPAREKPNQGYSGAYLGKNLKLKCDNSKYLKRLDYITKSIKSYYGKNCIILILGAGDIFKIKNELELS